MQDHVQYHAGRQLTNCQTATEPCGVIRLDVLDLSMSSFPDLQHSSSRALVDFPATADATLPKLQQLLALPLACCQC